MLTHAEGVQEPFAQRYPGYVLVELADTADEAALNSLLENVIGTALERGLPGRRRVRLARAIAGVVEAARGNLEAQRADGPHLKHGRVALPIERIPEFMASAEARVRALYPDIRPFIFGHFGDGNLHYNLSRPAGADRDWAAVHGAAVTDVVLDEVNRHGEHFGGARDRAAEAGPFPHSKDPLELRLMRDQGGAGSGGIMNPGKLL